ncbi:DUF6668 family protein [Streptomyces sp. NPDC005962]|uniref:DUF6668 family protein n=1 Tax=Streptomyces sp. NPDC005962 TaxID=3154466 RepID=UPI0033CF6268
MAGRARRRGCQQAGACRARRPGRGSRLAGHRGSERVVLVARSSAHGLEAAQNAAQQWASRMVTGVDLLGPVVVADAPGPLPRILRNRVRLVSGAVPRLWEIPWVGPWRFGETYEPPKECVSLARDLNRLTQLDQEGVKLSSLLAAVTDASPYLAHVPAALGRARHRRGRGTARRQRPAPRSSAGGDDGHDVYPQLADERQEVPTAPPGGA